MSREQCLAAAEAFFDQGRFKELLARRVAFQTESQNPDRSSEMMAYLTDEMTPYLTEMGFECRVVKNTEEARLPFLIGQRIENPALPTVLTYGHGDTVLGMDDSWFEGLEPWKLIERDGRWYGRGVADNKGQHTINLAALSCLLATEGKLGFNAKVLIEMGEEKGSPGLHAVCQAEGEALTADLLVASDGPRLNPNKASIYGGSRGVYNFNLRIDLREGGHHSGNWGGLLANPGIILAHAIASLEDAHGKGLVPGLKPAGIPDNIRKALAKLEVTGEGGPEIDPNWGEPGLTLAEKVFGWNTLDVLAFECGNPAAPGHAIPPSAWARLHIRYVADTDPADFIPAVRAHLDAHGFDLVEVEEIRTTWGRATRLDPENPWVVFALDSFEATDGVRPDYLPNLGGTLPNDAFSDVLGLPTIWVPHSYGGCSQHAPNEHYLPHIARQGLRQMTGLFYDLAHKEV